MTDRELAVYEFIICWKLTHDGDMPTYRQILQSFDPPLSLSMVFYYLHKLRRNKLLVRIDGVWCTTQGAWSIP